MSGNVNYTYYDYIWNDVPRGGTHVYLDYWVSRYTVEKWKVDYGTRPYKENVSKN